MDVLIARTYTPHMVRKSNKSNTSSKFDPAKPYNDLPLLPPQTALETLPVLRKCVSASRALEGRELAHGAIWDQDYPSVFKQLSCPILALCAEDDSLRPFFDRVRQARPDIKAVITGPAKYFSPEYDTERTVEVVRTFLDDVETQ